MGIYVPFYSGAETKAFVFFLLFFSSRVVLLLSSRLFYVCVDAVL